MRARTPPATPSATRAPQNRFIPPPHRQQHKNRKSCLLPHEVPRVCAIKKGFRPKNHNHAEDSQQPRLKSAAIAHQLACNQPIHQRSQRSHHRLRNDDEVNRRRNARRKAKKSGKDIRHQRALPRGGRASRPEGRAEAPAMGDVSGDIQHLAANLRHSGLRHDDSHDRRDAEHKRGQKDPGRSPSPRGSIRSRTLVAEHPAIIRLRQPQSSPGFIIDWDPGILWFPQEAEQLKSWAIFRSRDFAAPAQATRFPII